MATPVGTNVGVSHLASETGQYKHTVCTNTIVVNKGEKMPPCQIPNCPNKGADWVLNKILT
jgi:hypothetical protein